MTHLFTVDGVGAAPASLATLSALGFQERAHLQEWIIAHPEILGDVMIITSEYDRWSGADGTKAKDRLDILALESSGRLVVCELKRDNSGPSVHLQAITYAALASRFTMESLVDAYQAFRGSRQEQLSRSEAETRILDYLDGELDHEMLRRPRIVLVAGTFAPQVTHTAVWLNEMGVSVTLLQYSVWQVAGTALAGFTQLYPTPELEEFVLSPSAGATATAVTQRARKLSRRANAVSRIIASELLEDGTPLELFPASGVNEAQRRAIQQWVEENPARGRVTWRNDKSAPLVWEADGVAYRPTTLAHKILLQAAGAQSVIQGTTWWRTPAGADLASLADGLSSASGAKDWSDLHEILAAIPNGRWTTYGDLATTIETGPQALGQHVTKCLECSHAWRILTASGAPAPGFSWTDPNDHRSQEDALVAEGITFTNGVADPALRLSQREVADLLPAESES